MCALNIFEHDPIVSEAWDTDRGTGISFILMGSYVLRIDQQCVIR